MISNLSPIIEMYRTDLVNAFVWLHSPLDLQTQQMFEKSDPYHSLGGTLCSLSLWKVSSKLVALA